MWELYCKESWVLKNWCYWTVVLEKTLESPLDCKEIQPVHPKGNQSWIFIGRADAKAKAPIFWPPDAKNTDSLEKISMLGKIEGRRRRDDRRWDGWMASLTQWTWVWASSGIWWWTRKPGMLQSMGLQRVRHDWATELNWSLAWSITLLACEMTQAIQSSHTHTHTHTQSRNRCFSGTLLLFWWFSGCWQFDLWFLCLF